jgi:glycosyltransferase involved in cell wall biosynthesis
MPALPLIAIDCERMKYPHTGLYHFCRQLSEALIRSKPPDRELCFYTAATGIFGEEQQYLKQHSYHKFLFPSTRKFSIWHSTHQDTDYFPSGRKLKKLLTVHDLNYLHDSRKTEEKKNRFKKSLQQKIDEADQITAISAYSLADLRQHFQLLDKPCTVIYNGCNMLTEYPDQKPAGAPSKPFLFTIGTITEKKNFHVLPALLEKNDYFLVIAGITQSSSYKEKILQEAKRFGVSERLLFTGPVSEADKQWYLKHCLAFVFPSLAEGFGLPVVEAMHFGRPTILSNATSLPEIGGTAASYFENFDPSSMQQILEKSLHEFQLHPEFSEKIRQQSSRFSWSQAAAEYHGIYSELLRS